MLTATLTSLVKQAITTQLSQSTASFQRENFYVCVCVCVFKQIHTFKNLVVYREQFGSIHEKSLFWSSRCGTAETNPTMNHEVAGLIPGLRDPA